MKPVCLFLALFFYFSNLFSQSVEIYKLPLDSVTGDLIYKEVIEIDSASKTELYNRAKVWFVNTFKDAEEVIQLEDEKTGKLMGKGSSRIYCKWIWEDTTIQTEYWVTYTVTVSLKNNRYKYEIKNIDLSNKDLPKSPLQTFAYWNETKYSKEWKDFGKELGKAYTENELKEKISDLRESRYYMVSGGDKGIRNLIFSLIEAMEVKYNDDW